MIFFADVWHGMVDKILVAHTNDSVLSQEELKRCDDFQFEQDQRSFVAAHLLVRNVLSKHADIPPEDWQFTKGPYGRPEIKSGLIDKQLFFNISHKPDAVCCLVSNIPECGVDLENHSRKIDWPEIGKTVFTPNEVENCNSDNNSFRNLWCLKEAYMKATGLGFNMDPLSCNITIGAKKITLEKHPNWQFSLHNIENHYTIAAAIHYSEEIEIKFHKI